MPWEVMGPRLEKRRERVNESGVAKAGGQLLTD
jgi:hypothetical protein